MRQGSTITTSPVVKKASRPKTQDFLLLLAQKGDSLAQTIHALYYLPENYKLLVLNGAISKAAMTAGQRIDQSIMSRIRFEEDESQHQTGTLFHTQASPFSVADAVIYNGSIEPNVATARTPMVLVSDMVTEDIATNEHHGFTVAAGNPEALATAVLRIARAQAW
jgi:hypothetical protein